MNNNRHTIIIGGERTSEWDSIKLYRLIDGLTDETGLQEDSRDAVQEVWDIMKTYDTLTEARRDLHKWLAIYRVLAVQDGLTDVCLSLTKDPDDEEEDES